MLKHLKQNFLLAWRHPRWRWALVVALLSDAVGFGLVLLPPIQWLVDAITVIVLFAVLGFRWPLLMALAVEAVPGLQLFPAWTLSVAALAGTDATNLAVNKKEVSADAVPVESKIEKT